MTYNNEKTSHFTFSLCFIQVLRESSLWETFEGGARPFPGAVILGDSAYPNRDWLVTPFPGDEVTFLTENIFLKKASSFN
jgi:hypothetical protein